MKRNQFTFYRSFYEAVMRLPKCQRLEMMLYIIRFALDGVMPENMTVQQEGQFLLIKPIISKARNRAKGGSVSGKTESGQYPLCNNNIEIEKEVEIENELEAEAEGFDSFWEQYPKKVGREDGSGRSRRGLQEARGGDHPCPEPDAGPPRFLPVLHA